MKVVNIYPEMVSQTFDGFGAAITEAAGHTFSIMSEEIQKHILDAYFGPNGNRYNLVRTHIDSCDFSLGQYAAMNDPEDTEFKSFSLERDEQYIIPLLKEAQQTAGKSLSVMLSPWSPPNFMKTNGQRIWRVEKHLPSTEHLVGEVHCTDFLQNKSVKASRILVFGRLFSCQ